MQRMLVGAALGVVAFATIGGLLSAQEQGLSRLVCILGGAAIGDIVGMLIGTRAT